MKRFVLFLAVVSLLISSGFAQTKVLGRPIVSKMDDEIAPVISANGRTMVFMLKDFRNPHFTIAYSEKKSGEWTRPVEITTTIKHGKLLLEGGYCLTQDGQTLYFSTKRHPSIGDYDIWVTHLNNGNWSTPENIGKPINSKFADAFPSISSDGNTLYFSRSLAHSHGYDANCSQLMMSKKKGSMWSEPVPISELNTGCETAPKILADNQTMIFSSKRNGKDDFDFYMSRLGKDGWGSPELIEAISTEENDLYCSMAAEGKYVFHSLRVGESMDLARTKLSEEFRPKTVRMYRFRGYDETLNGKLVIRDVVNKKSAGKMKLNKTYKTVYLPEGGWYDVSYYAKDKVYYSEFIDATGDSFKHGMENRSIKLSAVAGGSAFELSVIFNSDSSRLDDVKSLFEFKRAARLIREYEGQATLTFVALEIPIVVDTSLVTIDSLSDSIVVAPVSVPETIKLKPEEELVHNVYAELKKYLKEPEKLTYKVDYLPASSGKIGELWVTFE
jgi:hypothetical protein